MGFIINGTNIYYVSCIRHSCIADSKTRQSQQTRGKDNWIKAHTS
jgi:hypothetical protein